MAGGRNYGPELYVWVGLSTAAKPSSAYAGQRAIETDTNDIYQWFGNESSGSWVKITESGSLLSRPDGYDTTTGVQAGVTYAHHEIHDGNSYFVGTTDLDLDNTNTLIVAFQTPDTTKWFHMIPFADNSLKANIVILEGPTITNGSGSDLTVFNRNRNSSNVSGCLNIEAVPTAGKATLNPTITADGTILETKGIGANTGISRFGGETRGTQEIILKQNTRYAVRITGLADNGVANILLSWYEHTSLS